MAPTVEHAALCSAEATSSDDVDDAYDLIASLPPLPEPRKALLCRERLAGVAVVGSINGALHAAARVAHRGYGFGYAPLWEALLAVGAYETAFAFLALLAINLVDVGVIRRSADRCLPLPAELAGVVKRLGRGRALVGVSNPTREDGSSYCVRCFVWRRPPRSSPYGLESLGARCTGDMTPRALSGHHCSTCGVCVEGYDHHCAWLGVCVTRSNMPIFISLLLVAQTGVYTVLIGLGSGVYIAYGRKVFAVGLAVICAWCAIAGIIIHRRRRMSRQRSAVGPSV